MSPDPDKRDISSESGESGKKADDLCSRVVNVQKVKTRLTRVQMND